MHFEICYENTIAIKLKNRENSATVTQTKDLIFVSTNVRRNWSEQKTSCILLMIHVQNYFNSTNAVKTIYDTVQISGKLLW